MANFLFLLAILITSLLLKKLFLFDNRNNKRYSLPPSPPSLPFIGHLHLARGKSLHHVLARFSGRYGPVLFLRFGIRRVLLVSSQSLAEECFTRNDLAFASRPHFPSSQLLTYNYTSIGASSYGPHWRNVRRIVTVEVLSTARLNMFCAVRLEEVHSLLSNLFREHCSCREKFKRLEIKPRIFGLALNVIMRMIAGKRYYVENAKDSDEARSFRKFVEDVLAMAGTSNPSDFLPILGWINFQGLNGKIDKLAATREKILQGLVDERRKGGGGGGEEKKRTLLEVMLCLQEEDPDYYTDDIIKAQIQGLLVAGSDTTSETVEWAMSRLVNQPELLRKARAEIDAHVGNLRLLEERDLPHLPYLHGVICETFRMHPSAPLLVPHECQEPCTVGGYDVPVGTLLMVNARAIHRDPEAWEEPLEFRPERFMDAKKGELEARLLPFGMGRRKCPGEGLATRLVGLVLGTMIQCFNWEQIGDEEVDMTEKSGGVTLPKAIPLELNYRPRKTMIDVLSSLEKAGMVDG